MGIFDKLFKADPAPSSPYGLDQAGFARGLGDAQKPVTSVDSNGLGALVGSFAHLNVKVPPKPAPAAPEKSPAPDSPEALLFNYKKQALALAQGMADLRKQDYEQAKAAGLKVDPIDNFRPTMTDYFRACELVGEQNRAEMATNGVEWNPKVYADLSGQRMEGFQINKAHLEAPPQEILQTAMLRALQTKGARVQTSDVLDQIGQIQRSGEKIDTSPEASAKRIAAIKSQSKAGIEALKDTFDLDGDHVIAKFYEAIDRHANFKGTLFSNVNFHPAGTLMRNDENGIAWTAGASFENVTFDGMGANDRVVLEGKQFSNIHVINSNGGKLTIPDNTQVYDLTLAGKFAELHTGRALISGLETKDAMIEAVTSNGTKLAHGKFDGVTIDPNSQLAGSKWTDFAFTNCNFDGVDTKGMILNNVAINDCHGVDLTGAQIGKLAINGTRIENHDQLAALGVAADATTLFINAPSPQLAQAPPTPPNDPLAAAIAAAAKIATITQGGEAVASAQQSTQVASMERKVNPNQVASPGDRFMAPNQGQQQA